MKLNEGDGYKTTGHLLASLTILVWGTTYISTKVLLRGFEPTEILMMRFLIGFVVLFVMSPHLLKPQGFKTELTFALCGLSGITIYYLLENIALTMTQASHVGVIICTAPFFTVILLRIIGKNEAPLRLTFFIGFLLAMAGITLISVNGEEGAVTLRGDLLSLLAAVAWAVYSILMRNLSRRSYSIVQCTRRCFFYAILFMIPAMCFLPFHPDLTLLGRPAFFINMLFLGIVASGVCFVTWNESVRRLGAVTTSIYIYLTPVVTVLTARIILDEKLTAMKWVGVALTLIGLILSERGKGGAGA